MSNEEAAKRISAYITCLKCEISGKECDDNCRYQYEAGTMGEIVDALETLINAEPQERTGKWIHDGSHWANRWICDRCKYKLFGVKTKFCPDCGQRMEVEHEL